MARVYVLPPLPCAPYVATSSARFGRSDGAAEYHGSKSRFQLFSTYPSFCQLYLSSSEHHPVASSTSSSNPSFPTIGKPPLLSISQSLSKTNLSTDLYDYPLFISVSIPHIYLLLVLNTILQLELAPLPSRWSLSCVKLLA